MFTRNFYKMLAAKMTGVSTYVAKSLQNTDRSIGMNPGIELVTTSASAANPSVRFLQTATTANGGVILGDGETAPTLDDYKLSGQMITAFAYNCNATVEPDENGMTIKAVYTITNSGSDDFTIRELGIIVNPYNTSGVEAYKVLIERTVLDSPVTIPAGGVGQVTYAIRMDFPTA